MNDDSLTIAEFEKTLQAVYEKIPENDELKFLVSSNTGFEILNLKLSINILLDRNHHTGILPLLRVMMENSIYLKYILKEDSSKRSRAYQLGVYRDIKKQYEAQKRNKKLQKMREQDKSLNKQIVLYEQNSSEIMKYIEELDLLYGHKLAPWYNDDRKTTGIYKLFERMDKSDWYDSVYRYLCMESHGNIGLNHIKRSENGITRLNPTTWDEDKISNISCSILNETKKELAKLIN